MSKVTIIKKKDTVRFDHINVGDFFNYGNCSYLRCSVETQGPAPRNTVRLDDGASIRFEPHMEVNPHEHVEIHLK